MIHSITAFGLILMKGKKENDNRYNIMGEMLDNFLSQKNYNRVIDIGCGDGKYGDIIKKHVSKLVCFDIDENAICNLPLSYDKGFKTNILTCNSCLEKTNAELLMMTEFLEHIPKQNGIDIINNTTMDIFITTPSIITNVHMIGHIGNEAYKHVSVWSEDDLFNLGFNKIYKIKNGIINNIFYGHHILAIKEN